MTEHAHPAPTPQSIRAEAIETLLIERGLLSESVIDEVIVRFNERVGPMNGARIVARAWADPEFKTRLLTDGSAAIAEFDFEGGAGGQARGGREYRDGTQRGGVHVVLLLSVGRAGLAAALVQRPGVSLPDCSRAPRRTRGVRSVAAGVDDR